MFVYIEFSILFNFITLDNVVSGQARKGRGDEKIGGILETTFTPTTGKVIRLIDWPRNK